MFKHLVTTLLACVIFSAGSAMATPLNVVVSIAPPQRYLVHAIAGDLADVAVLIAPRADTGHLGSVAAKHDHPGEVGHCVSHRRSL